MNNRHDRYRSEPLRQSDRGQPVPTAARMMTVMRMKGLSDKARLVLAVLANHDGAGGCYPPRALIASEASMSPRSVDRALAECRSRGVLNSRQRRGSNVYKIDYGWTAERRQTAPTAGEVKSLHAASDPPRAAHRADLDPCAGTAARGGRERCLTPRGRLRHAPAPCGGREPRCTGLPSREGGRTSADPACSNPPPEARPPRSPARSCRPERPVAKTDQRRDVDPVQQGPGLLGAEHRGLAFLDHVARTAHGARGVER